MKPLRVAFVVCAVAFGVVACGGRTSGQIGDACTPSFELDPMFNAFTHGDVYVGMDNSCQSQTCLVNHFRGRTTCPYGQNPQRLTPEGSAPCAIPGRTCDVATMAGCVIGRNGNALVPAQCANRRPADAVYCSCRCANGDGKTNDGAPYCACPSGFECRPQAQPKDDFGFGRYCVRISDHFDPNACEPCSDPPHDCG